MVLYTGEFAALATSLCWTITALSFEYAAKRIGSLSLNIHRLVVALIMFMILRWVSAGEIIPLSAPGSVWFWLSLSGLVGFTFGDIFLFQSYIDIGARSAQAIFISAPLLSALLGFLVLGEHPGPRGGAGMVLVVGGVLWVVLEKRRHAENQDGNLNESPQPGKKLPHPSASHRLRGVLFAFLAAVGQAGGLVLSKIGAPSYNPFAATQIRVLAGLVGFMVVAVIRGALGQVVRDCADRRAMGVLTIGAFFGPFLGVSLGLVAVQRVTTGIAATLMGLTPLLIIPPSVWLYKEKVWPQEIAGVLLAFIGSVLIFLR